MRAADFVAGGADVQLLAAVLCNKFHRPAPRNRLKLLALVAPGSLRCRRLPS